MDFARIFTRARNILTTPRTEWPVAAAEPATVGGLYAGYIALVAALPALAGFVKGSLIGYGAFGVSVRTPLGMGLAGMLLRYALSLAVAYLVALLVDALAGTFGARKDLVQALKTVAYAWTAAWIAGIGVIVPWLGWLIALAGAVYAVYLLYLGLPHTMRCPPEKAGGYAALTVVVAIVLSWLVGLVVAGVVGAAALTGGAMHAAADGSGVTLDRDSALGRLAAVGEQAAQAGKQLEAAQQAGGGATAGQPAGGGAALPTGQLKALLPDSLPGFARTGLSAERNGAIGLQVAEAEAEYGDGGGQRIALQVADTGGARGLVAMAAAMAPEQERQTGHGYEKTYRDGDRLVHEAWDDADKSGEFSVVVGRRFTVKASGRVDGIDRLRQAVASVDLAKLESLGNQGAASN